MDLSLLYYLQEHFLEINWSYKFTNNSLVVFGEYNQYEVNIPNANYSVNIEYFYETLKTDLTIYKKENNYSYELTKVYFPKLIDFEDIIYKVRKDIWGRDNLYLFPNKPWRYY